MFFFCLASFYCHKTHQPQSCTQFAAQVRTSKQSRVQSRIESYSLQVRAVPIHRMTAAGSRKVQVCKHQGDEAERKRYESHNPSGCWSNPEWFPLFPSFFFFFWLLLSQTTRRSQHPSGHQESASSTSATSFGIRVPQFKPHRDERTRSGIFTLSQFCVLLSLSYCFQARLSFKTAGERAKQAAKFTYIGVYCRLVSC